MLVAAASFKAVSTPATDSSFVFGVDLDGVCADYTLGFREIVAERRGVDPESLPIERSWDWTEWNLSADEFAEMHRYAVVERHLFRTLPAFPQVSETLWRLSDAGIWIRIITHRLYVNWGHAAAVADTVQWLDDAKIPYRDICFLGKKPQVEADCYIDDAAHNVEALRATGNPCIVFDQPYNRHLEGPRASTWEEVEELVLDFAARKVTIQPQFKGVDAGGDRLARHKSSWLSD